MMGKSYRGDSLFYTFRLDDYIPKNHLLRVIHEYVDLSFVRERLASSDSHTGRPSIDAEILLRILLIGYFYGITSERRLVEEIGMPLAYRWFTGLDFNQTIPDHFMADGGHKIVLELIELRKLPGHGQTA